MVYYHSHNTVYRYWRIHIHSTNPMPENQDNQIVFKGKTENGALKAAQRYCDKLNSQYDWQKFSVGKIERECDAWGR